ncbi:glycoside-pentoside-hexuronide (GPH):cation symporter [Variovorax sp. HJSM1_2]|uniref:glycoside-pentoside-hexuronide (GPH):cation symporter n=1 Tax=Variovorax sp. HJSM1_2 TaxID=3366263 RepID=UPI003BDECDEB
MKQASEKTYLSWSHIAGYGLGDFANNLVFSLGALFLLNYYTDVVGFSLAVAGSLILLTRGFSAFTDVVAGRTIDRLSPRLGRFRPFLLWGAIPLMLANVAIFSVPPDWAYGAKLAYAVISCGLLVTAYSFVNIPYGALASVMTQAPHERALLGVSRTAMSLIPGVALAVLLKPLLGETQDKHAGITHLVLYISVIGVFLYMACFKLTRETVVRDTPSPSTRESIRCILTNKPLITLCATTFLTLAGAFSMASSLIYFTKYVLRDLSQFVVIIGVTTILGTLVSGLLTPFMVKKLGKKTTCLSGLALTSVGHGGLFLFSSSDMAQLYLPLALIGCGQMMVGMTTWALAADTVEYGEWRSSIRIEGLTYSVFSCARKAGQALGGALPAFLLGFTGYAPNVVAQSDRALLGIQVSVSLLPALAYLLAFLVMLCYPLDDRRFMQILQEIKTSREAD